MTGLIAHEWIERHGGAEKVLDTFVELFPDVDFYCLWNDARERYPENRLFESPLARSPLRGRKAAALPLMSRMWSSLDLRDYEWALISSHSFAHHLGSGPQQRHLSCYVYVHTPARYVWAPEHDPHGRTAVARLCRPFFKWQDRKGVNPAGNFAANSHFVRERVRRSWGVDAEVIYPPVDIGRIQDRDGWRGMLTRDELSILATLPKEFVLGASRFVEYKGLQHVIEIGTHVGLPVVIAGSGPLERVLRQYADSLKTSARFIISPSDPLLWSLYDSATVFVYPPVEDFGIMPIEAQALGTPVVVNYEGGARESSRITGGGIPCTFAGNDMEYRQVIDDARGLDMCNAARRSHRFSSEVFRETVLAWRQGTSVQATAAAAVPW